MKTSQKSNSFLALLNTHKGIIYKIAHSYCTDSEARKDLAQEIIVQIWKSFDRYDDRYKQSTWIYRIALNVAISFYRKESRRKEISSPLSEGILNFAETHPDYETELKLGILQQFISELKELDKALMLLYLDEKSYKEISEIIGITETNVATKIGRIKILLKQKFSNT
jgi:RNA polymerase sigma factor (sigma-70 family)